MDMSDACTQYTLPISHEMKNYLYRKVYIYIITENNYTKKRRNKRGAQCTFLMSKFILQQCDFNNIRLIL